MKKLYNPDGVGAELLEHPMVYLDTSAWNDFASYSNREGLIASLRDRQTVVLGSVISAGELLQTRRATWRADLSAVMRSLIGERALLERPLAIAQAAAEAFLRGDKDVLLRQTGPGRTLRDYLNHPDEADDQTIGDWLDNLDDNLERFRAKVVAKVEQSSTHFHSPENLGSEPFLQLLLTLPPAIELGLTLTQVGELCARSDIWRALAGAVASVLTQVISRSPKKRNGHKRPDAADLWQAVYLGVVEVFITSDVRQLEAISEASAVLHYPRCVVYTSEFLAGLGSAHALPGHLCRVCGCLLAPGVRSPDRAGLHARVA